jgi:hypothetical protein
MMGQSRIVPEFPGKTSVKFFRNAHVKWKNPQISEGSSKIGRSSVAGSSYCILNLLKTALDLYHILSY